MNKFIKLTTVALTTMTLGGVAVSSTTALADSVEWNNVSINYQRMNSNQLGKIIATYNMDHLTTEQEKVVQLYTTKVQSELSHEIEQTAPTNSQKTPSRQTRGAAGLMARLIAKYGKRYVAKTLPKLIYKKVAKLIGKKVSQAKFVKIWNNAMNVATGAALQSLIAKALKKCGLSSGVANTAAAVIVTAIDILV